MGCNINAHFEIKVDGEWLHYSNPSIRIWYDLFAKIANVRNRSGIVPISEPKGLPDDLNLTTKLCADYDGVEGHYHTWLNADEIKQMCYWAYDHDTYEWEGKWEHVELGYLFGNGWGYFNKYRDDYPNFIEDIRFICWFDG